MVQSLTQFKMSHADSVEVQLDVHVAKSSSHPRVGETAKSRDKNSNRKFL